MVARYKSIEDMVNAGYQSDLRNMKDNPDTPYMHIENPIEAMDRIRQSIKDRKEEQDLNEEAGVQFGAVVRQGRIIEFPERRKRYVFKLVEEEY